MAGEDEGVDKSRVISEVESSGAPSEAIPGSPDEGGSGAPPPAPSPPPRAGAFAAVPLLVTALVGVVWLVVGVASRRFVPFLAAAFFLLLAAGLSVRKKP